MPMSSGPRFALAAVVAAAVFMLAAACGGGDSKPAFNPANADQLAHAAIISMDDLPGKGWEVAKTDEFSDQSGPFDLDTEACRTLKDVLGDASALEEAAGKAETEYQRSASDASIIPASVEMTVKIFKDTKRVNDRMPDIRKALAGDKFETCLDDYFKDALANADPDMKTEIKVRRATPTVKAPAGGEAKAIDLDMTFSGSFEGKFTLRMEMFLWPHSNAGVTLLVSGLKDELPPDLVKTAVTKAEQAVKKAEKP